MSELRFILADVFTDRPFGGNPLAVFPDAGEVTDEGMRALARELNLSETVFVFPGGGEGRVRVRIFTPGMELPYAGHPTVGTACLLAQEGIVPLDDAGRGHVVLEEGVGPIPVDVRRDGERWSASFVASNALEVHGDIPTAEQIGTLIRLEPADIIGATAASLGVPFLLVQVRDVDALARVRFDVAVWERVLARAWAPHVYAWTRVDEDVRARMFAPAMGIAEDPATGAAASALCGHLALAAADGAHALRIHQGLEMGRPSLIETTASVADGKLTEVRVGGSVVRMGAGSFDLP